MRRMRLVSVAASLLALFALILAAAPAQAQAWAGKGRLQGSLKDEQGKPVQGATITLRKGTDRVDPKADGPKPLLSDKNGKWSILGLGGGAGGSDQPPLLRITGVTPTAPGQPVECFNANAAVMRAEALSHKQGHVGAVAFSRTGDPATGVFNDAEVIRKFGDVPDDLSAL